MDAPYGSIDPNSEHQTWSRWTFRVVGGRRVPMADVQSNGLRWLREGFKAGSVGRVRFFQEVRGASLATVIQCEIEGKPAHDPGYVRSVKRAFNGFVEKGWGRIAVGWVTVDFLAGSKQDGKPREQLIVMPRINLLT